MHTPGEWAIKKAQYHTVILSQKDKYSICSIIEENKSWKANANLIAAAPELLKACKSMIKNLQKEELTQYVDFHIRKQLREAIAKAESK